MKTTIKAFVYVADFGSCDGKTYVIFNSDTLADKFYTLVGPVDVDYEIPPHVAEKLVELKKVEKEGEDMHIRIMQQINKLQAMEITT